MKQWYFVVEGEKHGPVPEEDLLRKLNSREIASTTLVWSEGFATWTVAHEAFKLAEEAEAPLADSPGTVGDTAPCFFHMDRGAFFGYMVLSWGIFEWYWMYQNWRYVRDKERQDLSPYWRSCFGVFWIHDLMTRIKGNEALNAAAVPRFSPGGLATCWIIVVIIARVLSRTKAPFWVGLSVDAVGWLCMLPVQAYINQANARMRPARSKSKLGGGFVAIIILGVLLWLLNLVVLASGK